MAQNASNASDAIMQELLRWARDRKPEEKGGWKSIFLSPGFIIGALCIVLIIILIVVWWRWGGKPAEKAPDVENPKAKSPPDSRNVRYATKDGKSVSKEQVR